MQRIHQDPKLNQEQLSLEDLGITENLRFARFVLSAPYLVLENGVRPATSILYPPTDLSLYIPRVVPTILKELIFQKGILINPEQEISKTIQRLYDEDQTTLDKKFKINAFQVEGTLSYKIKIILD